MWLLGAFISAAFLGVYDVFKKKALSDNAVIPVLLLNTIFSSLIFIPFILLSAFTNVLDDSLSTFQLSVLSNISMFFLKVSSFFHLGCLAISL